MKAKFIGKSSMGFISGRVYDIKSEIKSVWVGGLEVMCIYIYDKNSKANCPYRSLENIMENWVFIPKDNTTNR